MKIKKFIMVNDLKTGELILKMEIKIKNLLKILKIMISNKLIEINQ